jgi:hypothetical protein
MNRFQDTVVVLEELIDQGTLGLPRTDTYLHKRRKSAFKIRIYHTMNHTTLWRTHAGCLGIMCDIKGYDAVTSDATDAMEDRFAKTAFLPEAVRDLTLSAFSPRYFVS